MGEPFPRHAISISKTAPSQVFQALMERSNLFDEFGSELIQCGVVSMGGRRIELLKETSEVANLSKDLTTKLKGAKQLRDIQLLTRNPSHKWSLLANTAYSVGDKASQNDGLNILCCTVINEVAPRVLEHRKKLLQMSNAMDLRLSLWLHVNQWLKWNPSKIGFIPFRAFEYWDMVPDQIPTDLAFYSEEGAKRIRHLLLLDFKRLKELGDLLTQSPALCNNPDSQKKEAVISSEIKVIVDATLDVRKSALEIPETLTVCQAGRELLDQRRNELCPPNRVSSGEENPCAHMAQYQHSQVTFKTFSVDEIRSQAGREVLPEDVVQNGETSPGLRSSPEVQQEDIPPKLSRRDGTQPPPQDKEGRVSSPGLESSLVDRQEDNPPTPSRRDGTQPLSQDEEGRAPVRSNSRSAVSRGRRQPAREEVERGDRRPRVRANQEADAGVLRPDVPNLRDLLTQKGKNPKPPRQTLLLFKKDPGQAGGVVGPSQTPPRARIRTPSTPKNRSAPAPLGPAFAADQLIQGTSQSPI